MLVGRDREVENRFKAQKTALYVLLGMIYVSFICMQLGEIQAITDYSFTLHEMLFFPALITFYVGPFVLLLYIVLAISYLKIRPKKSPAGVTVLKSLGVMLSLIFVVAITVYQFGIVSSTGFHIVEAKFEQDGEYTIYVQDITLEVTKEDYDAIQPDTEYFMNYKWHELTPEKGKLMWIENSF